jgi:glutaminase
MREAAAMQGWHELDEPEFERVSTGRLPTADEVEALLRDAYARYAAHQAGAVSQVYPALAAVDPDLFGVSIASARGRVFAMGDTDHPFTIMSISKPFVFALVCQAIGARAAHQKLGGNATGLPFNALEAVERSADGRTNPMVNPGAIAATSLVPGATADEKWDFIVSGLSKFAGRALVVNDEIYASASATNFRNREIIALLERRGAIDGDPAQALDLYTRQCSLEVTAADLALMGATLALGGVHPVTGERVVAAAVCHYALAAMTTAGMYETSGDWLYEVGLPGKSGIGGGVVTVSPGKGGIAVFAPRLDGTGNSVKGQLVSRYLSRRLGLDLFIAGESWDEPTAQTAAQIVAANGYV